MRRLIRHLLLNTRMKAAGTWMSLALGIVALMIVVVSIRVFLDSYQLGQTWQSFERGPGSKSDTLGDLRASLGYGGMIHEFKNFILRGDNILIAHAGRKVDDAYRAINTYIELGVNDRERQAYPRCDRRIRDGIADGSADVSQRRAGPGYRCGGANR